MARIEKTVFISYRRTDVYTALAVYENLKNQGYDVFFDYRSISSGDFEQIITSNIRARAHFLIILTPTALDRCNEPGDWLRREIEIAIEEKRNIIPLFFKGFRFGTPAVSEKLTGKLKNLSRYNGLNVHEDYFEEAMQRVRAQFLSKPLDTVLHPVSTEVRKVVREEQVAADEALREKKEDIQKFAKPVEEKPVKPKQDKDKKATDFPLPVGEGLGVRVLRPYALGAGILLLAILGIMSVNSLMKNAGARETPIPTANIPSTPVPSLGIGSTMTGKDGMTLLYVPAGEFTMGSEDGSSNEEPVHTVSLDAFWIDQTEVTVRMYYLCVEAGVCEEPINKSSYTRSSYYGNGDFDNYPVIHVNWNMAKTYCEWADRRLPTEAEWEKAARWSPPLSVGEGRGEGKALTYPWGENIDCSLANYGGCIGDTIEVGKYPNGTSPYGALDMAGNVWEWVEDLYDAYPGNTESNSSYGTTYRVLRGGAWFNNGYFVRSAYRGWLVPMSSSSSVGFRCSRSP